MSVSYDKATKAEASSAGRTTATVSVAGLTFQGGVTPTEQGEIIALYTKLNARQLKEKTEAANAPPPAAPPAA